MPAARFALYVSTAGVLAMFGGSLLTRPPSPSLAGLVLAGYVSLLLAGVFVIRLRVFVDAVLSGPSQARGVALTFDDGPHPVWTPRILDILAAHGVQATFFVIARKAEAYPEVIRTMVTRGHDVGLHGYAHPRLFALWSERSVVLDLDHGIRVLTNITGGRPGLFRPPMGHTNPRIARAAERLALTVVGWTLGARDGVAWTKPADVVARVRRGLRDGVIVALHDAPERGEREPAALRALPLILGDIANQGLDVVPLSRWALTDPRPDAAIEGRTT